MHKYKKVRADKDFSLNNHLSSLHITKSCDKWMLQKRFMDKLNIDQWWFFFFIKDSQCTQYTTSMTVRRSCRRVGQTERWEPPWWMLTPRGATRFSPSTSRWWPRMKPGRNTSERGNLILSTWQEANDRLKQVSVIKGSNSFLIDFLCIVMFCCL